MPLNPTNFSRANYEPDYSGLANIFQNYYKGQELAQTPQRLEQEQLARQLQNEMFGEQITGQQLSNQYNPQLWQEQLKHSIAQRGLFGAQGQEHAINARKQQMIADILQQAMGGQQDGAQSGLGGMEPGMEGAYGQNAPQGGSNSYLGNAVAAHALGIPQHHPQITGAGEIVSFDPLTGQPTIQGGLRTPEDIERGKKLAEHNVDAIKQNYDAYSSAIAQKPNLQGALKHIENPKFAQAVGPWKNVAAKYLAPDDVKELQASFSTLGKNIVTESAKSFSRLTQQEMNWLQTVLPSPADTLPAIKGKLKTLETLRAAAEQKAVMKDQMMRNNNIDPIIADQLADQQIDYNKIIREIKPTISMRNADGDILDIPKYDAAFIKKAKDAGYEEGDF